MATMVKMISTKIKLRNDYLKKICLIASSGGHFEQISMLKKLTKDFDVFFVTEKTKYRINKENLYYVKQVNRKDRLLILNMCIVFFQSLCIFFREKPDVIVSTGALSVLPMYVIGKLFKRKLVFIESFAKVTTPTKTGKFLYKFVDVFIVQWQSMLKYYPNAIYLGSIY